MSLTADSQSGHEASIALVQGASRGIGFHIARALLENGRCQRVFATCRRPEASSSLATLRSSRSELRVLTLDVLDEASIERCAEEVQAEAGHLDLLVNCSGVLHEEGKLWPEKRLADVEMDAMVTAFRVNALGALLVARAFEPVLRRSPKARFVALSARVGSIGDNRRGGWYAYRSSKAALNMMIRTLAIEWSWLPRSITCFALHPGTVATDLSEPFRKNMSARQVVAPQEAAERLLLTIQGLTDGQSGGFYAYDGTTIEW